jgi:superfamily II DNA or RNA helicase
MKLFNYQKDACKYVIKKKDGALITLKPGSGKSLIIYKLTKYYKARTLIVSLPLVLVEHKQNIKELLPEYDVQHIKTGKTKLYPMGDKSIVLVSYGLLRNRLQDFINLNFDFLVVDESHCVSNPTAKRSIALHALRIAKATELIKVLLLSATPCSKGAYKLYSQVYLINPKTILGTPKEFFKNHRRRKKLKNKSYFLEYYVDQKRIKKEAKNYIFNAPVKSIPNKIVRIKIPMPGKLKAMYTEFLTKCSFTLRKDKKLFYTSNMGVRLMQLCAGFVYDMKESLHTGKKVYHKIHSAKLNTIKDYINECESPLLLFSHFREELFFYKDHIKDSRLVIGSGKDNEKNIIDFKSGKFKTLIANPMCVGTGVSFQNCRVQIATSFSMNPTLYTQTIYRNIRASSKFKEISRYEIIFEDTIEERYLNKLKNSTSIEHDFLESIILEATSF